MMEVFTARLEACDPAQGRFRAYRLAAGKDLLGDWLVEIIYGRTGTHGRCIRYVLADKAAARKMVRHCLQRRATARRRIGVGYQFRKLDDPAGWLDH